MTDLARRFQDFIDGQQLFNREDYLLVAVSGGVDSVLLCHLCRACGYRFSIAHMNFSLRGEESDADASFVQQMASEFGIPCFLQKVDTERYAAKMGYGIQEAARELRYDWLLSLLKPEDSTDPNLPDRLLTAHHQNDNVETLLMNFFKGTGIRGLHGIPARNGRIARPLLFASKAEIRDYASMKELRWREDSSNITDKYSRNFMRLRVLPLLEELYPTVVENLADNIHRFGEIETVYLERIAQLKKKWLQQNSRAEWQIPVSPVKQLSYRESFFVEVIADFGFSPQQAAEAVKLLYSAPGKYISSPSYRLVNNRKWLVLVPIAVDKCSRVIIDQPGNWSFPEGILKIKEVEADSENLASLRPNQALINAAVPVFPLTLRKWKTGDYFYPLGMNKKKKIARFLIDARLSLPQKERQWLLESDRQILWLLGRRIDHRCRIRKSGEKAFLLTWQEKD